MATHATLFYKPNVVQATLVTNSSRLNYPMYNMSIDIFRGVSNTIYFELKDSNRQPVKLFNNTYKLVVVDVDGDELLLTKYLFNDDEQNGKFSVTLQPGDIDTWQAGFYKYSVTQIDVNGYEQVLYTSLDQTCTGQINIVDSPFPRFVPSVLIQSTDWTQISSGALPDGADLAQYQFSMANLSPSDNFFVTNRFPGAAQKSIQNTAQTFSISTLNFSGDVWLQASLDTNPTKEALWFNVSLDGGNTYSTGYTNDTSMSAYNFTGNFIWIRFKYQPYSGNTGSISKIWLKN